MRTAVVAFGVALAYLLAFLAVASRSDKARWRLNLAATMALGVAVLGGMLL